MAGVAVMEPQTVTAEQVLRDALHHIREGWIQGAEMVDASATVKNRKSLVWNASIKAIPYWERTSALHDSTLQVGNTVVRSAKPEVEDFLAKANEGVRVCSIGGIFLARALLNGDSTERVREDAVAWQAMRILRRAIVENFERRLYSADYHDGWGHDEVIVSFNDDDRTTKSEVVKVFEQAIEEAEAAGL